MKYVALLRGINVGGNSMVKMADLKICFEKLGFQNVRTFINSGNVVFETDEKAQEKLIDTIQESLQKTFHLPLRIVVRSHAQLKKVVENIPTPWKRGDDLRCYIAFIKEPTSPSDAYDEVDVHKGVDFVEKGHGVLYMATKLSDLTSSGLTNLIKKKIYKEMTMRNLNTTQKLLALMED